MRRPPARIATTSLRLLSDERLARLAAEGGQAAFAAIYERHHQALYRYCRTITRNDEDARDALQATMLKAMNALDTKPRKVRAWLYRIAHNESISILRNGRRNAAETIDDVEPSAEAPLEERRELRDLLDDIAHLSDRQRQALVMRELGGLSYEEIGTALSCSPAAAKQAAFDARTALHELAEARDTDCESIRRRISDGDRRMLRARGVRAHLRSCGPCRRFDATLRNRQARLAGLVPVLSPAASAAILNSVLGSAGATGAGVIGGGAAAIGGGAAVATSGGAVGGAVAMKGVIAGVAALVATGGVVAIEEERDAIRDDGSAGSAVEAREATDAPAADRAGGPATAATAAGADVAGDGAAGTGGHGANANTNAQMPGHSGSASALGEHGAPASQSQQPPQGDHFEGQHGPRPPGGQSPQPGAHRPPVPLGGGPADSGTRPPGEGTRPPGETQPPAPADGTTDTMPPGSSPPPPVEPTTETFPAPDATSATTAIETAAAETAAADG